eukprot:3438838-Alexandrium_andersonii.AAC.1
MCIRDRPRPRFRTCSSAGLRSRRAPRARAPWQLRPATARAGTLLPCPRLRACCPRGFAREAPDREEARRSAPLAV